MKKLILLFLLVAVSMLTANSQTAMTPASGSVDSSATEYITATISGVPAGTAGYLVIQPIITKVANTGSTVAGYCLLQGSIDGTNWVNVPTWKRIPVNGYGSAVPFSIYEADTFTLTNVTTAQTKAWQVTGEICDVHPYLYYRVAVVMTTTKVTATGNYLYRRKY